MEEDEKYDSDGTVLLVDFIDKPKKIDVKRRRLSQLQDRNKQSDQCDDENATPNVTSENIQLYSPVKIKTDKDWLITRYFTCINKNNNAKVENNVPNNRENNDLYKKAPKNTPCRQTSSAVGVSKENTAKITYSSDIICLDSDDESPVDENFQKQDINNSGNSPVNLQNQPLIVLKPAAINAGRATTISFETNKVHSNVDFTQTLKENNAARLKVLKPSIINARRTTMHFEKNINETDILKYDSIKKYRDKNNNNDNYRLVTPGSTEFQTPVANTTNLMRQEANQPARLKVLKPSTINAQRRTTHFEENYIECNLSNDKSILKNCPMKSYKDKKTNKDSYEFIAPRVSEMQISVANATSGNLTDTSNVECQAENNLSNLTKADIPFNTDISDNSSTDTKIRQVVEDKTNPNVKTYKRSGDKSESPTKRTKTNTNCSNDEKPKISELCAEASTKKNLINDEHKTIDNIVRNENNDGYIENKDIVPNQEDNAIQFEKEGKTSKKQGENMSNVNQEICKLQDEQVVSEVRNKQNMSNIIDEQISESHDIHETGNTKDNHSTSKTEEKQEQRKLCDQHYKEDARKMQENQDGNEVLKISEIGEQEKNNQSFEFEPSLNQDKIMTDVELAKQIPSYVVAKTIANETNETQNADKVLNDQVTIEADFGLETAEYDNTQGSGSKRNEKNTNEVSNKQNTIQNTTKEGQEAINMQNKLKTSNVQEKEDTNEAFLNHETDKPQDEQRMCEAFDTGNVNKEQPYEQDKQKLSQQTPSTPTESRNKEDHRNTRKTNEMSRNVGIEDHERVLKFQVGFFTLIKEYIIKIYPEFAAVLNDLIQTLISDAKIGKFQTSVQFSCPTCRFECNYSSNFFPDLEPEESKLNTDNLQNCVFCCGIRKLHASYLKRYLNKEVRVVNNKKVVHSTLVDNVHAIKTGQCGKSTRKNNRRHAKSVNEENICNDPVFKTAEKDSSSLFVERKKLNETDSRLESKKGNHDVSKELNIGEVCTKVSECDKILSIAEKDTNNHNHKEVSNHDTPISVTPNNEISREITLKRIHINDILTIKKKSTKSNKRTNDEIEEQAVIYKRMRPASENLNPRDTLNSINDYQNDISVNENNKTINRPTREKSNTEDELPKNIQENSETPCNDGSQDIGKIGSFEISVGSNIISSVEGDKRHNGAINFENNNVISAENSQVSLQPQGIDDTVRADTNILKTKSDSNDSNEMTTNPTSELKDNDISVENNGNQSDSKNNKDNESIIRSLINCFAQLKNNTEDEEVKENKTEKISPDVVTKESHRPNQLLSGAMITKYICPICTCEYTYPSTLLRHMKNEHKSEPSNLPDNCVRQQCPFCNRLLFKKSYNKHVARCSLNILENGDANINTENHDTDKNKVNKTINSSESSNFTYRCSVCDKTITNDYSATRLHRKQLHPELKHRRIIEKIRIGNKSSDGQEERHNKDQVMDSIDNSKTSRQGENGEPETIITTDIANETSTSSNRKDSSDNDDESSDFGESSYSDNLMETSEEENNNENNENKTPHANEEGKSKDIIGSKDINVDDDDDDATRKQRTDHHPNMQGVPILNKNKKSDAIGDELKSNRKESKHLLDSSSPSPSNISVADIVAGNNASNDKVSNVYDGSENTNGNDSSTHSKPERIDEHGEQVIMNECTDDNVQKERSTRGTHNSEQCSENKDSKVDSCEDKETASEDETIKPSENLLKKRKELILKRFGDESQASVLNDIHGADKEGPTETQTSIKAKAKCDRVSREENTEIKDNSNSDWNKSTDEDSDKTEDCESQKTGVDDDESDEENEASAQSYDFRSNEGRRNNKSMHARRKVRYTKKIRNSNSERARNTRKSGGEYINSSVCDLTISSSSDESADSFEEEVDYDSQNTETDESSAESQTSVQNGAQNSTEEIRTKITNKVSQTKKHQKSKIARERRYRKSVGDNKKSEKTRENAIEQSSGSDWIINTDECADTQNRDIESCDDSNFSINEVALLVSEDDALQLSTYTLKNRKERITNFLSDDSDGKNGEAIITNMNHKHGDNQCGNNDAVKNCKEVLSDNETVSVSENTIRKKRERMAILFDDGEISANKDCNNQKQNSHINLSNRISATDDSGSKDVEMSKNNEESLERSNCGNNHDNKVICKQVRSKVAYCTTSDDHCDMDTATDKTNITQDSVQNNISVRHNSNPQLNDDDQIEIDLIDGLLDEYNKKTPDDQPNNSLVDKENDGKDEREPINDVQSSAGNRDRQASLPSEKTSCLENIQITNVRSIANKCITFICQECCYATDSYDNTIRHCQNHYNRVEDRVIYCNICQVKYDASRFEIHQMSHRKNHINVKIKFSYQKLFSNWQVFENNNILLSEVEDIQVKTIYKTHSIKMTIKEDGPWQTALYLCAKCNTCVPPLDLEKHVQKKCALKSYPCVICNRAFLTHEMLEHHKTYHADENTSRFKTISFNEENDENFNAKLIQVKSQLVKNREKQRYVDIYKCMCGLCFITMRKLKLHFVDCGTRKSVGVKCTKCSGSRQFLPFDLDEHLTIHHSAKHYVFRLQEITFRQEYDYGSSEQETTETTTDNAIQIRSNVVDKNTKKDNGKDKTLSQVKINSVEDDSEISTTENVVRPISIDEVLNIDEDVLKDESLSQNTNEESRHEDMDIVGGDFGNSVSAHINEDFTVKNHLLNEKSFSQHATEENKQENMDLTNSDTYSKITAETTAHTIVIVNSSIDVDLHLKGNIFKDESMTQHTIGGDKQDELDIIEHDLENKTVKETSVELKCIAEDLNIKRDMLKDELLSQNTTNDKNIQDLEDSIQNAAQTASDEDLLVKKELLKDESQSQNTIEDSQGSLYIVEEPLVNSKAEKATEITSTNETVNDTLSHDNDNNDNRKKLDSPNDQEHLESGKGLSHIVASENPIIIEDSDDDDVELIEEREQRFRCRGYPDSGDHWELRL